MNELRALIADACAAPNDDAPRLAIAALLEACGDALGAFIRRQVARTAHDARHGRPRPQPSPEERATREAAAARWIALVAELALLARPDRRLALVRGMPAHVRLRWSDLPATELLLTAPVQHLDLVGVPDDEELARLLAHPWIAGLESLSVRGARLGDRGIARLAGGKFPALRWLDVSRNEIEERGAEALIASVGLPRLAQLQFGENPVDPTDAAFTDGDLDTFAVYYSQHGAPAPDETGASWDDHVADTEPVPWARRLEQRYGRRRWLRVLWRSKREVPRRDCLWPGLRDVALDHESRKRAVFLGADFALVDARGSTWSHANLAGSVLDECDFSDAELADVHLAYSTVGRCRFAGARAQEISFEGARIADSDFAGADLRFARFEGAEVVDTSFRGARLGCDEPTHDAGRTRGTRFVRCDFRGADLQGRELEETRFIDCSFVGTTGEPRIWGRIELERPEPADMLARWEVKR